jgi:hypothetical protein
MLLISSAVEVYKIIGSWIDVEVYMVVFDL